MPINKCTMAIRVLLTYEKQAETGEFIDIPEDVINLLNQYKESGKLIGYSKDDSQTNKVVYTIDWKEESGKQEFRQEGEVINFADKAEKHNYENRIQASLDEFYV
tara:strand:- start:45 stop:359 length:315 start_codon:yes stop_codon:yes gene_type:complete